MKKEILQMRYYLISIKLLQAKTSIKLRILSMTHRINFFKKYLKLHKIEKI